MSAGERVEGRECSHTVDESANSSGHSGDERGGISNKEDLNFGFLNFVWDGCHWRILSRNMSPDGPECEEVNIWWAQGKVG